jgi:uncharacterized protein (TIGR03435 family)
MYLKPIALPLVAVSGFIWAQSPAKPQFDTASFKTAPAGVSARGIRGGPGTSDPGRISYQSTTLLQILIRAFGVQTDQISGPTWIETEKYEITATMPPTTTPDDFKVMLQGLLAERLGLVVHHESRSLPAYLLISAKGGSKLKPFEPSAADQTATPGSNFATGPDGCPVLPPGVRVRDAHTDAQGMECDSYGGFTMAELASQVAGLMRLGQGLPQLPHVIDRTGLAGAFDFKLRFHLQLMSPAMAGAVSSNGSAGDPLGDNMSSLTSGLDQLGLSLRKTMEPLDVIVIDKAERVPLPN